MKLLGLIKYSANIVFFIISGFVILSANSLNFSTLLLLAIFPIYFIAALLIHPWRSYQLGDYFFPVGIFILAVILLLMDYSAFHFPNPQQFFFKVFSGDGLSLANFLLLLLACFFGYFFTRSMESRITASVLFTIFACLFLYFLLDWRKYPDDMKFVACLMVVLILPIVILKFFPVFYERLLARITNLSSKDQKSIAHALNDNLKSFLYALNNTNLLLGLADFTREGFGMKKREFLKEILEKATKPIKWKADIKSELLTHFRETIEESGSDPEAVKYYEFIGCLQDLTVQERIRLCEIYFKEAKKFKSELTYHYHILSLEFKKVIDCSTSYTVGLSAVLYRYWRNKDIFTNLEDQLIADKRYIWAFANIEKVKLEKDEYHLFTRLPPFHPDMSPQDPQEVVKKILNEDDIDINGSTVNIWLIKDSDGFSSSNIPIDIVNMLALVPTSAFLLCGHSISPVCRRVTAAVNQAKQELKDIKNRFTAGCAYLTNREIHGKKHVDNTPFETLERSLLELKNRTGLLKIDTISANEYNRKSDEINTALAHFVEKNQRKIIFCNEEDDQEIPIILPIYQIKDKKMQEVSFHIPQALIASESYHTILSLYAEMSFIEMETDIKRKINVISFWKKERISEKESLQRSFESGKYLPIPDQYQDDPDSFISKLDQNEKEKYGYYARYGITDDHYKGERVKELIHKFVPWDDRIEQLEAGIKEDDDFLTFYKNQLKKIEQFRKDAGESSFEDELIDIMLRKWDLGFKFEKLKKLFQQWVDEVRSSVWTFVTEQLKPQDINLSFTSMPNLWFEVSKDPDHKCYHITPQVVVNANNLKIVRKKNLVWYEKAFKIDIGEKAAASDMSLHAISGQLRPLLSADYKAALNLFIKKSKELFQFSPQPIFDTREMLFEIDEKTYFPRVLGFWGRCLEESSYEEALEVLDELEADIGREKLPEIYLWRALTYAKWDADRVNDQNSLLPGYGIRTANYTELPYELLFESIIGTNRIKENEDLRKAVKHLIGKIKLTHRDQVKQNANQVKKIDKVYYEKLLSGSSEPSAARKALENKYELSEIEKRFYHFYEAAQLYKTLSKINQAFTKAEKLIELQGKKLRKNYEDIKNNIRNIAVPHFVDNEMIKLLGRLVRRESSDEMYMKVFFAAEIEVILDHLFIQCIENAKIAYQNNPGDKIIYDFLCNLYLRSVNFKDALWTLFPGSFPIIFSKVMKFSPESERLSHQKEDVLEVEYSDGYYLFILIRAGKKIQLGRYQNHYQDEIMSKFEQDLSNIKYLPSISYKRMLSHLHIEVPEASKEELFSLLEENLNDLIRALVYGEFKLLDESALKFLEGDNG